MARPIRLEFPGAIYHVTTRGNGGDDIFLDDQDRLQFLTALGEVVSRAGWIVHAYVLMDNHYHLLIETPKDNLSLGMRQLNGVYTQRFNRTHGRTGHVFQGRYKAIMVERDSYLLELARYVVLNPLRAGMVKRLETWPWSSYLATCGQSASPEWLQTDWLLAQFGRQRARAIRKYVEFVHEGARLPSVWTQLQSQIYLGSEAFVKKMQAQIKMKPSPGEIPRAQRRALTKTLADFEQRFDRNEAMARAYLSGQFTLAVVAAHFGVHFTTVSRLVREYENAAKS